MAYERCNSCIFSDICYVQSYKCRDYSPIHDSIADISVDDYIESERIDFYYDYHYNNWEYNDDLFF